MDNKHLEEIAIGSDRLKPYKINDHGKVLYISEPFGDFRNECDFCEHFSTSPMRTGGDCIKNGFTCGYGFTCEDYKYRFWWAEKS